MKKILGEILIFVVFCATSAAQTCKFYSSDYNLSSRLRKSLLKKQRISLLLQYRNVLQITLPRLLFQ